MTATFYLLPGWDSCAYAEHKDFSLTVDSSTDLKYQLDSLKKEGSDFIKT